MAGEKDTGAARPKDQVRVSAPGTPSLPSSDPLTRSSDPKVKAAESVRITEAIDAAAEAKARAEKDAMFERRRNSITGRGDSSSRPSGEPATPRGKKKGAELPVTLLAGILVLALAAAGGYFAWSQARESSPEGRVRNGLGAYELAGRDAVRKDAAFAEIDKFGPAGVDLVVTLLADSKKIEQDGSRSDRTTQQIANVYLLRVAQTAKLDPPPAALEVRKALFDGGVVPAAKWVELQGAWRGWLDAARGKGVLPKS